MSINDPFSNEAVYREPKRIRRKKPRQQVRHNPRFDKTLKHIKGEQRQGRL